MVILNLLEAKDLVTRPADRSRTILVDLCFSSLTAKGERKKEIVRKWRREGGEGMKEIYRDERQEKERRQDKKI
jgi:hypothetical protein